MNDTFRRDAAQPQQPAPPPIPTVPSDNKRRVTVFIHFLVAHFWWVFGGAAGIKLISYFTFPTGDATAGYHFVKVFIGLVSYGGILALVAFVISKCMKTKQNVFRIAFAIMFALACLLDFPTAIMRSKANAAVENLAKSHTVFSDGKRVCVVVAEFPPTVMEPEKSGYPKRLIIHPGKRGTVSGRKTEQGKTLILIRWDEQFWQEFTKPGVEGYLDNNRWFMAQTGKWIEWRPFTSSIHPSNLKLKYGN
jgi:hypothetical protein